MFIGTTTRMLLHVTSGTPSIGICPRCARSSCKRSSVSGKRRVSIVKGSNNDGNAAREAAPFRDEELLAEVIARLIGDARHVAVGNASPIPATAALLARERGGGRPCVSLLQSR